MNKKLNFFLLFTDIKSRVIARMASMLQGGKKDK